MKKTRVLNSTVSTLAAILISGSVSAQNPKLTDPQIASVAVAANQIDVNLAKLAKEKTKNDQVIKFADLMIRDHQSTIDKATELVKKLGITPADNDLSKKLNSDATSETNVLTSKTGTDFNKAYIENEISYHKEVLSTINNVLIPQTKNAELKAFLEKVVPVVQTHLEHAEMIEKMLS